MAHGWPCWQPRNSQQALVPSAPLFSKWGGGRRGCTRDSLAGHLLLPLSLEAFWNYWEIFRYLQFTSKLKLELLE